MEPLYRGHIGTLGTDIANYNNVVYIEVAEVVVHDTIQAL